MPIEKYMSEVPLWVSCNHLGESDNSHSGPVKTDKITENFTYCSSSQTKISIKVCAEF